MQDYTYTVGEWLVFPTDNKISREGRELVIEPRLINMLRYFAEHPGIVLSRDELIDNVWTRNVVTPHVVTQCISELRRYLKDGRKEAPEYIITIPKRGYKLVASVTRQAPDPLDEQASSLASKTEEPSPVGETSGTREPSLDPAETPPPKSEEQPPQSQQPAMVPANQEKKSKRAIWPWLTLQLLIIVILGGAGYFKYRPQTPDSTPQNPPFSTVIDPGSLAIQISKESTECGNSGGLLLHFNNYIAQELNNYSSYRAHDLSNYTGQLHSAGKTLLTHLINRSDHHITRCFLSIELLDNANHQLLTSQRYIVNSRNLHTVQLRAAEHLFAVLGVDAKSLQNQEWSPNKKAFQAYLKIMPVLLQGDFSAIERSEQQLQALLHQYPDFVQAKLTLLKVQLLLKGSMPRGSGPSLAQLYSQIITLSRQPELQAGHQQELVQLKVMYELLNGSLSDALTEAKQALREQKSWFNYILLGKCYEISGRLNDAADAYIAGYSMRPGQQTYTWIQNALFQTDIQDIVPYLYKYH
ncbi:lysine decarboxylation/transport transcriptional activator CadC [Dongshaea marina]|uniref:lysine decarboxylation/transport transcriptional activator CadC n=1 Tax=Dongshaea marina TaxID=2047966 RepID=UPI000D3E4D64|nr:lysine decarboxylation/transport transcriptional activator CadC [Dongshaea marina]